MQVPNNARMIPDGAGKLPHLLSILPCKNWTLKNYFKGTNHCGYSLSLPGNPTCSRPVPTVTLTLGPVPTVHVVWTILKVGMKQRDSYLAGCLQSFEETEVYNDPGH